jgi:hypothetical protein
MYELVLAGAALVLALHVFITRRATLPRPPGPKGLPLVGNAFQMPQVQAYLVFAAWAKKYGAPSPGSPRAQADRAPQATSCPSRWSARL